ncbi:hypothetical protein [Kitasatospora sp. NPDC059160]|uniref:hypothetical protein n=1 Tax=Kitasatospora sp. NPDC059160 TaxID=3346748 RepID=UPI0036A5CC0E
MTTTDLPGPRELFVGIAVRLKMIAPVVLALWLLGVQISAGARLLLVPVVLAVLALDVVAHHAPHAEHPANFKVRRAPAGSNL